MASFTERYHELTKYNPHTIDKLGPVHWDSQPPAFKSIRSKEKIDLLAHLQVVIADLEASSGPGQGGLNRPPAQSGAELGLENIARLLFFTMGLTARLSSEGAEGGGDLYLRAAPSAGGLYPTEVYVAVRNQTGLADGLYHYHSLKSALIPVWQGSFWGDLKHYFLGHPGVESADLILIFTGLYGRSAWRYKERAYRRILLDTGHAVGNLLEVCRHSGLDYTLLGGFLDAGLEELLFLTSKEEFPLLGVAIGPSGTLPSNHGQYPSDPPDEAVQRLSAQAKAANPSDVRDPIQVQQNACERILALDNLRSPIPDAQVSHPFSFSADPKQEYHVLKTILNRRSCRKFNGQSISLAKVREALAYAFRSEGNAWTMAPGHLDYHVVILNVEGLEAGVYLFHPNTLTLEPQQIGDFRSETLFLCLGQELAAECAYALIYTSDLAELAKTYGDRGYRYACMDAGQIGQRINLWTIQQGFGSSGIGGYYDDQGNELLGLPLSHGILYITLVGVPDEG